MQEFANNISRIFPLLPKEIQESWKKDVIKWMFGGSVESLKAKPLPEKTEEKPLVSSVPKAKRKKNSREIFLHGRRFPNQKALAEVYNVTAPWLNYRLHKLNMDYADIFPHPPKESHIKTLIRKTDENGNKFVAL